MVGFDTDTYETYLLEEERARFVGLKSAELQYVASSVIWDYEEEIQVLRDRIQIVKSFYNSGASVNERLPNELLVQIFREVGPRTRTADAIRLTHVCRSWRSLIHGTPVFWADFLVPDGEVLGRRKEDLSIVRTAFERSAPIPALQFSLNSAFLSSLKTIPDHVARITTLTLDCLQGNHPDIHAFFQLQMPHLEDLSVWLKCSAVGVPRSRHTSLNLPRLRRLSTTCVAYAVCWIKPTVRELVIGRTTPGKEAHVPCCTVRKLDFLWNALKPACHHITKLKFLDCISKQLSKPSSHPLDLSSLDRLTIRATGSDTVRVVLASMKFPETAQVTLASHCSYHELGLMGKVLHTRNIGHVAIDIGVSDQQTTWQCSVKGYQVLDEGLEKRLTLFSLDPRPGMGSRMDLLRFFQGSASIFLPQMVTGLDMGCTKPIRSDNGGWLWLFRHFPRLVRLDINIPSSENVCTALAQKDVLSDLRDLRLRTDTQKSAVSNEILVSVLEERASRGLHLRSFFFTRCAFSWDDAKIPQEVAADLRRRLEVIVPNFSFVVRWGVCPGNVPISFSI